MSESWKVLCDYYARSICLHVINQFCRSYLKRTLEPRDVEDILINMGTLEATALLYDGSLKHLL